MSSQIAQIAEHVISANYQDFVGFYKTTIDTNKIIEHFEWMKTARCSYDDNIGQRNYRKDEQLFLHEYVMNDTALIAGVYNKACFEAVEHYCHNYNRFIEPQHLNQCYVKLQKTLPGGGYHAFHYERDNLTYRRTLTTMLYLNDVEDGGETEFLYQHLRVKPEKGTLLIWPCEFTHMHRGNPPLSGEKYIATSWLEVNG